MKKLCIGIFFIIIISFQGCTFNSARYINFTENTSKSHYYEEITEKLQNKERFTVEIFDNNFYKSYTVKEDLTKTISGFFNSINSSNFIEPLDKKQYKKSFEIILRFDSKTYYLNVLDDKYVSISPFDGHIKSDFIDMSTIDTNFNLYNFCNFIAEQNSDN